VEMAKAEWNAVAAIAVLPLVVRHPPFAGYEGPNPRLNRPMITINIALMDH